MWQTPAPISSVKRSRIAPTLKKRKRGSTLALITGCLLFLIGLGLFLLNSPRRIWVRVDGIPHRIMTWKVTTRAILQQAGVTIAPQDRVFPPRNYWVSEAYAIRVDHQKIVILTDEQGTRTFPSFQSIAGNILQEGGVLLFPKDQLFLNETPLSPAELLESSALLTLRVVSEETSSTRQPLRIHIQTGTEIFDIETAAETIEEALAHAGITLQGLDYTIPDSETIISAEQTVQVIRVAEEIARKGEPVPAAIQWLPDDQKALDDITVVHQGTVGMKGTLYWKRTENGIPAMDKAWENIQFSAPIQGEGAYGTKITLQTETVDGITIEYWRKVPVYATAYSPCRSGVNKCINGTASGRKVERGVIGVSRMWYDQFAGLSVYVPGYGQAVIGDVGRSPTGDNRWIDLAYRDDDFVGWSGPATLYFLAPVPTSVPWILP